MFSQTVEYILRVVVFLASRENAPATTSQISEATQVPIGYLAKIMQRLVKSGLVKSQRGRNGGFLLTERAFKMSLFDIIQSLEPIVRIAACPLNVPAHKDQLCPLHQRLDSAIAAVEQTLQQATVSSLLTHLGGCHASPEMVGAVS